MKISHLLSSDHSFLLGSHDDNRVNSFNSKQRQRKNVEKITEWMPSSGKVWHFGRYASCHNLDKKIKITQIVMPVKLRHAAS